MAAHYIFTIENLSKAYGKKEVLQNIWLSFYPGAKIGVIGGNGSGKSTLLRIMAGIETDYIGIGPAGDRDQDRIPSQEPMLDPTLDVRGNVETAVAPIAHCSPGSTRSTPAWAKGPTSTRWTDCSTNRRRCRRHRDGRGLGPRPPHRDRHGCHAAAAGRCRW